MIVAKISRCRECGETITINFAESLIADFLTPMFGSALSGLLQTKGAPREIVERLMADRTRKAMIELAGGYAGSIDIECGPENNSPETIQQGFMNVTISIPRAIAEELGLI